MQRADSVTVSSPALLSAQLSCLILLQLLGLSLNLTVLFVVCRRRVVLEHRRRYILLGNLLACDFILLLWVLPMVLRFLTCATVECRSRAAYGPIVCQATGFLFQCAYLCGMVTQVFLALDRTMTTAHPCLSLRYFTCRVYLSTAVFCWAFAVLHASVPLAPQFTGVSYVFSDRIKRCTLSQQRQSCWYYAYINFLVHGVMAPGVLACYLYTAFRIWQLRSKFNMEGINRTFIGEPDRKGDDLRQLVASCGDGRRISRKGTSKNHSPSASSHIFSSHITNYYTDAIAAGELFAEFQRFRGPPLGVADVGVQTSCSGSERDIHEESLASSDSIFQTSVSRFVPTSGTSVNTTVSGLGSETLTLLNFVPSDVSDLKGLLLSRNQLLSVSGMTDRTFVGAETPPTVPKSAKQKGRLCLRTMGAKSAAGSKKLTNATVVTVRHGVYLVVTTYIWSLPYTLVTKCPREDVSMVYGVLAMMLCYSSSILYPLVYFFIHNNFVRHLRVSVATL